jgi:hypothetical protein
MSVAAILRTVTLGRYAAAVGQVFAADMWGTDRTEVA